MSPVPPVFSASDADWLNDLLDLGFPLCGWAASKSFRIKPISTLCQKVVITRSPSACVVLLDKSVNHRVEAKLIVSPRSGDMRYGNVVVAIDKQHVDGLEATYSYPRGAKAATTRLSYPGRVVLRSSSTSSTSTDRDPSRDFVLGRVALSSFSHSQAIPGDKRQYYWSLQPAPVCMNVAMLEILVLD